MVYEFDLFFIYLTFFLSIGDDAQPAYSRGQPSTQQGVPSAVLSAA